MRMNIHTDGGNFNILLAPETRLMSVMGFAKATLFFMPLPDD